MAKPKKKYVCSNCGYTTSQWIGKCPGCHSFSTLEEQEEEIVSAGSGLRKTNFSKAKSFSEIECNQEYRIVTGIKEFDRVYGDGIVSDSVNAIAAPPGAGKTTLLLEAAVAVARQGHNVLYASAEESEAQLKKKCERLFDSVPEALKILSTKIIENAIEEAERLKVKMLIIDSNKAFMTLDAAAAGSRAGSPSQMLVCTDKILDFCKNPARPCVGFIISQFTKDEKMAGPEEFKHAVDSSAYLDYTDGEELRILRTEKNRFNELENGIFMMCEKGVISVDNPNEYFVTERGKGEEVPGVALTVIKEGSRPLVAEIECLTTRTYTPYPSRIATCLRRDNINILLSIITEIIGIDMNTYDVIINTTNGLRLIDKSTDLAVIMCILSSVNREKKTIPNDTVFLAEVGLTGELKKVQGIERCIKELDRMGYKRVFIAKNNLNEKKKFENIEVIECKNIKEVFSKI